MIPQEDGFREMADGTVGTLLMLFLALTNPLAPADMARNAAHGKENNGERAKEFLLC